MPPKTKQTQINTYKYSPIVEIEIRGLFGYFKYTFPEKGNSIDLFERLLVIYGLNGTGKTTILNLIYHTLSPRERAGHRTALAAIPFSLFRITLASGSTVTVSRTKAIPGTFKMSVSRGSHKTVSHTFKAIDDPPRVIAPDTISLAEQKIYKALADISPNLFHLPDDRSINVEIFGKDAYESKLQQLLWQKTRDALEHSHESYRVAIPIIPALESTIAVLNQSASFEHSHRSTMGTESAHSIYLDVIKRISSRNRRPRNTARRTISDQLDRMENLASANSVLETYGLTSSLKLNDLIKCVANAPKTKSSTIITIIAPYLDGLEARFAQLKNLHERLDTLVTLLNRFFQPKQVGFSIQSGLSIRTKEGESLDPSQLSSGERHLLLILTTTYIATRTGTLFLIDEPELSLNPEWQKLLLDAVLRISNGTNVQFIMASHGTPLIARHLEHVVNLNDC